MTERLASIVLPPPFPDHTQLPESDGTFGKNFYQQLSANERGHYPITPLNVELGLWQGSYQNQEFLWLRWWDLQGNLLLIGEETAKQERLKAERAEQRAKNAEARAARLAERLRAMGIEPDVEDIG